MNKKGFTLTELIAIIVVISIIALIAVPAVVNSIKNNNHDSYTGVINDIILGAETYAANMGASVEQVSVETLKQAGYLPLDLKNPVDNTNLNGCVYIVNGDSIYKEETCSTIILNVTGIRLYKDSVLNGLDPVLDTGLIPVTIDEYGNVKKASLGEEWYNYAQKKWANAVILKGGDNYLEGESIPESAIESYFVWIPKFKYKLFDMGNYTNYSGTSKPANSIAHSIDVVFDPVNTTDSDTSCITPLTSGGTNNCSVGKYMTHPAFITMNVPGLWVGKFETGYEGTAPGNTSAPDRVIIKPNVPSWKSINAGNIFTTSYNYKRDMDSHMMKNTEWGAVAYLSLSNYGINDEIRINNSSTLNTGCAATVAATNYVGQSQSDHSEGYYSGCENTYNSSIGKLASTTGNITGIYDMSGGVWEYMAAYISGNTGSSELNPANYDSKYFDVYNIGNSNRSYNSRILGDATGELGPFYYYKDSDNTQRNHNSWFSDFANFVYTGYPWFNRSGGFDNGVISGQLNFGGNSGSSNSNIGSRIVLAPKEEEKHEYAIGTTWDFNFSGGTQDFIPVDTGTYKLEVWGAQGGYVNQSYIGGYGGYSTGTVNLIKGNAIYVTVGSMGGSLLDSAAGSAKTAAGGYNGGGNGYTWIDTKFESGGGGATHIAINNNLGELKNYNEHRGDVLIVAGGGGGAGGDESGESAGARAGDGGGYTGNLSTLSTYSGGAGTQTAGGAAQTWITTNYTVAGFGQGGSGCTSFDATTCGNTSGGGGGYFGGGAGCGLGGFGGGGSGYIGNTNLSNKKMVCYNCTTNGNKATKTETTTCANANPTTDCAKQGNGYARITLISY